MRIRFEDTPQERMTFALCKAVQQDDLAGTTEALANGASAKGFTRRGTPLPLNFAKSAPIAELLIEHGAPLDKKSDHSDGGKGAKHKFGNTALHVANVEVASVLLSHGASVDVRNKEGDTPLHWASKVGNAEKCQLLIDHGADPNARSKSVFQGATSLHFATNVDVLRVLLASGADPTIRTDRACFRSDEPITPLVFMRNIRRHGVADFLESEIEARQLMSETQEAAGAWSPDPKEADAQFDRRYAEAAAQGHGIEPAKATARLRL